MWSAPSQNTCGYVFIATTKRQILSTVSLKQLLAVTVLQGSEHTSEETSASADVVLKTAEGCQASTPGLMLG